jgi:hypothetical protein
MLSVSANVFRIANIKNEYSAFTMKTLNQKPMINNIKDIKILSVIFVLFLDVFVFVFEIFMMLNIKTNIIKSDWKSRFY